MGKKGKRKKVKAKIAKQERRAIIRKNENRITKPLSFKDNKGNIITPIELVFPIIQLLGPDKYRMVGTGFFVHPSGGFVTAKHCLYEGNVYQDNCYAIHSISVYRQEVRKIQYFKPHPVGDIGMGMLRGQLLDAQTQQQILKASLPISLTPPALNDEITTLAYPRMKINHNNVGTFPCDRYAGKIVEHLQTRSGKLTSETYVTTMQIKSGASGGPVLRGNHIIGVNSTSFKTFPHEAPISFITPISLILDLELEDSQGKVASVKELMEGGHMAFVK
jgi:hypothetical protein